MSAFTLALIFGLKRLAPRAPGLVVAIAAAAAATWALGLPVETQGPVAGMLDGLFLLAFMAVAAPLAAYIPLSALAAVLVVVAWNMIEGDQIAILRATTAPRRLVFLVTALLTIFRDITEGIAVGVTLGSLIFMHRMAQMVAVETQERVFIEDEPDAADERSPEAAVDPDFVVYRISGPFFFGAATTVAAELDQIGRRPKAFVLDLSDVPFADGAGANALRGFVDKERRRGGRV